MRLPGTAVRHAVRVGRLLIDSTNAPTALFLLAKPIQPFVGSHDQRIRDCRGRCHDPAVELILCDHSIRTIRFDHGYLAVVRGKVNVTSGQQRGRGIVATDSLRPHDRTGRDVDASCDPAVIDQEHQSVVQNRRRFDGCAFLDHPLGMRV